MHMYKLYVFFDDYFNNYSGVFSRSALIINIFQPVSFISLPQLNEMLDIMACNVIYYGL